MVRVPPYVWWILGGAALFAVANTAKGRGRLGPFPQSTRKGLVVGGKTPGTRLKYLYERTPTHLHRGIDIMAPRGSAVYAPKAGKIAAVWKNGQVSGYGNTVVLRHAAPDQTMYSHLDSFAPGLKRGQTVSAGQLLGRVGSTQLPRSAMKTGPHLHFEVHQEHTLGIREDNPERADPEVWLARMGVPIEAAA